MFRPPSFLLLLLLPPSVQPCDGNFEFSFQPEGRRERIYPSIHAPRGDNRGRDEGETRERRGRDEEAKRDRKHFDFVSSRFHFSRIARDGKDDERRGGGQGQSSERKRRAILTLREVNRPRRVLWILNCSTSAGSFVSMRFPPTSPPILNSVSKCCHRITFPSHRPLFNFQPDILLLLTYCPLFFRFTLCK